MSDLNEIKSRLNSVEQTRQITNAMYLLSSASLKRALTVTEGTKKTLSRLRGIMSDITAPVHTADMQNKFFGGNGGGISVYVLFMSDRGLCGSFNSDIAEFACRTIKNPSQNGSRIICYGTRGKETLKLKGLAPEIVKPVFSHDGTYSDAKRICEELTAVYNDNSVGSISVIYYDYRSGKPVTEQLLPICVGSARSIPETVYFEPSIKEAFDAFLPIFLNYSVMSMMTSSFARESQMRMEAMKSATSNADEMISALNTELNMLRQQAITNEIAETAATIENLNGC